MNFEKYLARLKWEGAIDIRAIRVKDLTDIRGCTCYNIILIPVHMDGEDGVSYRIETDIDEIRDRLKLWPTQFGVLGAWILSDMIKGAMYMEDAVSDYFESEV